MAMIIIIWIFMRFSKKKSNTSKYFHYKIIAYYRKLEKYSKNE